MKKLLYILCLLFITQATTAQYYRRGDSGFMLGVNAGYTYPLGDFGKMTKHGLGGNVSAKYLINRVIGIGLEAGYHSFKADINLTNANTDQEYKARLIPVTLEATFYIPTWDRTILPYLGIHFGAYITNISVNTKNAGYGETNVSENLYLISPGAGPDLGVLFELTEKIMLDIKIKGDYVHKIKSEYEIDEYTQGNIGFDKMMNLSASIGLLYRF